MKRGKGSITKTDKGKYLLQVSVKGGRRISRRFAGSAKDAERELDKLLKAAEHESKKISSPTLSEFWTRDYIPHCHVKNLAESTIIRYEALWEKHIKPTFGNSKLPEVQPRAVSQFLGSLSYGTAKHVKALLSSIFSYAEELELVELSVMRRKYTLPAKTPENTARKVNTDLYTWEEMKELASALRGQSFEPAVLLMGFGGLRREEACAIQPHDIEELESGWVSVRIDKTVQSFKGVVKVERRTKNEQSTRHAIIEPPFSLRLLELKSIALESGNIYMLQDEDKISNPATVSKRYDDWFRDNPYKRIPLKNLRASYTTAMIARGYDSAMISKITGHKTMSVTYKNYLKPSVTDYLEHLKSGDF